jgi:hypothetical protein
VIKPVVVSDVHSLASKGERGFNSHVPASLHIFLRNKIKNGPRRISEITVENENFAPYTTNYGIRVLLSIPVPIPLKS